MNLEQMIEMVVPQLIQEDKVEIDKQHRYLIFMLVKDIQQVDLDQHPTHCLQLIVQEINS